MPRVGRTTPLSETEKRNLMIMFAEAQARGIKVELPKGLFESANAGKVWPLDDNGYIIKGNGSLFNPNADHIAFLSSRARFSYLYGSRGCGKSISGSQKAIKKIMQGLSGAIINPDFENFKYSTWPEFREWIPWEFVVPSQHNRKNPAWEPHQPFTMVFTNGARVYCKGLKDPNSARGPNLNWLWYDESGRDETGEAWKIAISSIRVGHEPQAWATGSPKGFEHWTYKFFIENDISEELLQAYKDAGEDRPLIEWFHTTLEKNKTNLDPGFYAAQMAAHPAGYLKIQEVEGEYANEGGQLGFSSWFKDHVLDEVPEGFEKKVRHWDLAATERKVGKGANDPDDTVGTLMSKGLMEYEEDGKTKNKTAWIIEEQIGGTYNWEEVKRVFCAVALRDGPLVTIVVEQEPGSGGKNQIAELQSLIRKTPGLEHHRVEGRRPADRVLEANSWFAEAAKGSMYIVRGIWNRKFLAQLDGFMLMNHDDWVTSVNGAFHYLTPFKKWAKPQFVHI
jgi:phage terminase large subunit-like protein